MRVRLATLWVNVRASACGVRLIVIVLMFDSQ